MKSDLMTREETITELNKIIAILKYLEAEFDRIIANTEAAHEQR